MRVTLGAMAERLTRSTLTLCELFRVVRVDGTVHLWTTHDADVITDDGTYTPSAGVQRSAISAVSDMTVSNCDLQVLSSALSFDDVDSGLLDFAAVTVTVVDYTDPSDGALELLRGHLGEVAVEPDGSYTAELRSNAQRLSRNIGELYSVTCRADLGDARCRVNLPDFAVTGSVTTVESRSSFIVELVERAPTGRFNLGVLTWTSGANVGRAQEVRTWVQETNRLVLYLPAPRFVRVGDAFSVVRGCDKTITTCRDVFSNTSNFRGEPFLAGEQELREQGLNVPVRGFDATDGARNPVDPNSEHLEGPRAASHLGLQSRVGEPIPIVFGEATLNGNVLWARVRRWTGGSGPNADWSSGYQWEYVGRVEDDPTLVQARRTSFAGGGSSVVTQSASQWDFGTSPPTFSPTEPVSTLSDRRTVNNLNGDVGAGPDGQPDGNILSDDEFCQRVIECGFPIDPLDPLDPFDPPIDPDGDDGDDGEDDDDEMCRTDIAISMSAPPDGERMCVSEIRVCGQVVYPNGPYNLRWYSGEETQEPDPLFGADAPAFRGQAYLVMEDVPCGLFDCQRSVEVDTHVCVGGSIVDELNYLLDESEVSAFDSLDLGTEIRISYGDETVTCTVLIATRRDFNAEITMPPCIDADAIRAAQSVEIRTPDGVVVGTLESGEWTLAQDQCRRVPSLRNTNLESCSEDPDDPDAPDDLDDYPPGFTLDLGPCHGQPPPPRVSDCAELDEIAEVDFRINLVDLRGDPCGIRLLQANGYDLISGPVTERLPDDYVDEVIEPNIMSQIIAGNAVEINEDKAKLWLLQRLMATMSFVDPTTPGAPAATTRPDKNVVVWTELTPIRDASLAPIGSGEPGPIVGFDMTYAIMDPPNRHRECWQDLCLLCIWPDSFDALSTRPPTTVSRFVPLPDGLQPEDEPEAVCAAAYALSGGSIFIPADRGQALFGWITAVRIVQSLAAAGARVTVVWEVVGTLGVREFEYGWIRIYNCNVPFDPESPS